MRAGWQVKKLGDLLQIQNGYAFDSKKFAPLGGMPLIRIRDLQGGAATVTEFTGSYDEKYVVKSGDFLIGMDGEFECYEWKGNPALLNQRVCRLHNFDTALMPRFLFYGINSHLKEIEEVTGYTTVKHISSRQILDIDFPAPPFPEQQRIVGILDEAFDGIAAAKANAEKNLQNTRALFESHLQSVFTERGEGWIRTTIGDQVMLQRGFDITKDQQNQGYVPVVSSGGIKSYHDIAKVQAPGVVIGRKGTLGKVSRIQVRSATASGCLV
jgi:type I restriction enzyme S subunit